MPRFFVVGGYLPAGGALMSYRVAEIAARRFGWDAHVVQMDGETPRHGVYRYPAEFPTVTVDGMLAEATAGDALLMNPSFSPLGLGLRFPGRTLMYAQGFSTFSLLDAHFDRYVSVGSFVQRFLHGVYGIESRVIAAFIDDPPAVPAAWHERPDKLVLYHAKGIAAPLVATLVERALAELSAALPGWRFEPLVAAGEGMVPQAEVGRRLEGTRYLLTLSPAEGFGLIPLEAMARGVVVAGFDGFGGVDYMVPGGNCRTVPYGSVPRMVAAAIEAFSDPTLAAALSRAARATAAAYRFEAFETRWVAELRSFLGAGA